MAKERGGRDRSESAGDLHDLRFKTLLDDLVGDNALTRPTADLDVNHRTLTASPGSERLTRRKRVVPDRALLAGGCDGSSGNGNGTAAQLILVNFMRRKLNTFPRGARRVYATGL